MLVWHYPPTPSSAEVNERVELYLYSPSGPSWPEAKFSFAVLVIHGLKHTYKMPDAEIFK